MPEKLKDKLKTIAVLIPVIILALIIFIFWLSGELKSLTTAESKSSNETYEECRQRTTDAEYCIRKFFKVEKNP